METSLNEISERLIACKGWRWLPGMRAIGKNTTYPVRFCDYGERVFDTMDLDEIEWWQQPGGKDMLDGGPYPGPYLPDLTDPATLGCLLQLVRDAWGDPRLVAIYCEPAHPGQSEGWAVQSADNRLPVAGENYESEAAALVAALVAAP